MRREVPNPVTLGGIGPSIWVANSLAENLKKGNDLEAFERYWRIVGRKYDKLGCGDNGDLPDSLEEGVPVGKDRRDRQAVI